MEGKGEIGMKVTRIRHAWPEKKGFSLERPDGAGEFILLHFWQPMSVLVGGTMTATKPNALIIYAPDTPQKFCNHKQDIVHDWVHIAGDVAEALARYGLRPDTVYYPANPSYITPIIREMETEFFARNAYYTDLLDLKLRELFARTARHLEQEYTEPAVDAAVAESLKTLRQETFAALDRPVRVAELARRVGLSESRFYVLYKALFGVPPATDLIYARIERAKNLLARSACSVGEAARQAGYTNEYHFIRQFKSVTGMTPGKYRASCLRQRR